MTLSAYLSEVRKAINSREGWRVHRFATVGVFALARFILLEDLSSELWQRAHMRAQSVFLRLLGDKAPVNEPRWSKLDLDSLGAGSQGLPLILDADSGQVEAIEQALRGRSLVVRGAPGTGKSQTIANLAAAAIHTGKRVLVIANKAAALRTVERRLAEAGLSPF